MDLSIILDLIQSVAFPIVGCVYLGWLTHEQAGQLSSISTTLSRINDRLDRIEDELRKKGGVDYDDFS